MLVVKLTAVQLAEDFRVGQRAESLAVEVDMLDSEKEPACPAAALEPGGLATFDFEKQYNASEGSALRKAISAAFESEREDDSEIQFVVLAGEVELGMAVLSLERMLVEEKDHAGTLEIRDDKDKKLVGTLTCEVTALTALQQIDDEDAAAAAAAPPKMTEEASNAGPGGRNQAEATRHAEPEGEGEAGGASRLTDVAGRNAADERRARGRANQEATGALAQADEVPTGYRLSPRLPPASDMDVAASYPGRRPRAESIARADAFRAQPHHRASITTGPFSRGQGGAPATTRGAYGSGVGVGGVEVAPEFEFEPAEAEEPALAERLRHERAQLGELAQEVIALSGQLKRPAVVPGLVTAREQAQRDPPTPLLLGSARARRPCPLRESARLTALGGSGHPQQAAGPLSAQPLPRRARARSLLPWAAPQSADALCL